MRIIYTILLFISFQANATTYYVSNAGSDVANGTSTSTPFLTITKALSIVAAGDNILLNKGNTWNEKITPITSGTVGNVITIGSYGSGAKPIITGFQTLSGWTNVGNIWSSTFANSVPYQNTVYINGLRAKGRYPNTTYLAFTSHSGTTQITGGLSGDYTGGEVVIRDNRWTIDHLYITSQSGGTINFATGVYYALTDGYGYFIENHPAVLDTANEWCYDTLTKIIKVYSLSQPTAKASSIDTLVNISSKNYLTFDGIAFEGANMTGFQVSSSAHITITNCDLANMGANGISGKLSDFATVSNCTINNCWNDGILFYNPATALPDNNDAIITGNTVTNCGTVEGMGSNRFHTYTAIQVFGNRSTINNNRIDSIGYIGIYFYGDTCTIKNNYITNFCFVKDDGGGIYTWMGTGTLHPGGYVRSNIIKNGLSAFGGITETVKATSGIYMDNKTQYTTVDSNTVYNCALYGIFLHLSDFVTTRANTLTNCQSPFGIVFSDSLIFKKNILATGGDALSHLQQQDCFSTPLNCDSNYYSNRGDTTKIIYQYAYFNLKRWQDSGFDIHSSRTPTGVTSAAPVLVTNTTTTTASYPLTGTWYDMPGTAYTNTISITPFHSALIFKATTEIIPPETPVSGRLNSHIKRKIRLI